MSVRQAKPVNDPQEWALKRKAAVERAKQLREERKNGVNTNDDGEAPSFKPVVNKRPSYLDKAPSGDALDTLASGRSNKPPSDDIFEQPLPGLKANKIYSPGSDSLGKEMKKFPSNSNIESIPYNDNIKEKPGLYRSKFMQQYEDSSINNKPQEPYVPSVPINHNSKVYSSPEKEADENFQNILRSDSKKYGGGGWNDDTTTNGGFEVQKKTRVIQPRNRQLQPQVQQQNIETIDHYQQPRRRVLQSKNDWNGETTVENQNDNLMKKASPAKALSRPNIQSDGQVNVSPRIRPSNDVVVTQARSRLSLLKSKIRKSESSCSSRDVLRSNSTEFGDTFNSNVGDNIVHTSQGHIPKTAPLNLGSKITNDGDYGYEPTVRSSARNIHGDKQQKSSGRNLNKNFFNNPSTSEYDDYDDEYPDDNNNNNSNSMQNVKNKPNFKPKEERVDNSRQQQNQHPKPQQRPQPDLSNVDDVYSTPLEGEQGEEYVQQIECPDCSRKFNPSAYSKHVKICAKVFQNKRKVFDSKNMRVADNPELLNILKKKEQEEKKASKKAAKGKTNRNDNDDLTVGESKQDSKSSKWKEQSKAFRAAMRGAREAQDCIDQGKPLPPPVISAPDSSLIPCPHCGRKFNEKAGERHIPQCANIKAKPSTLKRGTGGAGGVNGAPAAAKNSNSKGRVRM